MIGDLTCTPCGSAEVVSITPGSDAVFWSGRSLDDQDIGVAPILLARATPDVCYCFRCWVETFRVKNAAQS